MNIIEFASPLLKVLAGGFAHIEVMNRPDILDRGGALIACNHVGWADSVWMAYAVYPRKLHFISKKELFNARVTKWILEQAGSFSVDGGRPSPSSIKRIVDLVKHGELLLVFPTGTRTEEEIAFKRGAATIALHAGAPIVPAFYDGPKTIKLSHVIMRPRVRIIFGEAIVIHGVDKGREAALKISNRVQSEVHVLGVQLG